MDYPPYPPNHCIGSTAVVLYLPPAFHPEWEGENIRLLATMGYRIVSAPVCTDERGGFVSWYLNPFSGDITHLCDDLPPVFFPFTPLNLVEYHLTPPETARYLEMILDQGNRRAEMRESVKLWFLVNGVEDYGVFDK